MPAADGLEQGCTNDGRQVAVATKFCDVAPSIDGFVLWNVLHVTLMAPGILRWLQIFGKFVQSWIRVKTFVV